MGKSRSRTFAFVLAQFVVRCEERALAPATVIDYRYNVESFLIPKLGGHFLEQLEPRHFDELYREMTGAGYAPATVRKCHVTACAALKLAQRNSWVRENVARLAEPPRLSRPEVEVPSVEEVSRFLEVAAQRNEDIYDYARVLAATGARPGEVCALRFADVSPEGVVTISKSVDCSVGARRVKQTKTNKTRRVSIDSESLAVIEGRRVRYGGEYVFSSRRCEAGQRLGSTPWRQDKAAQWFATIARWAGTRFTPRSLRHFHATQLLASGKLSVRQVADRLGHSSPIVTLNCYARSIPALDQVAADVIASVLSVTHDGPSR